MELERDGPGLLLRDILEGEDPQVISVLRVIETLDPDILLLNGFDFDHGLVALSAFARVLGANGKRYPFLFSRAPNTGMRIQGDMDRDGRLGEPEDAQGYAEFAGQGGMVLLSRFPIDEATAKDFAPVLWRDQPGAKAPTAEGKGWFDESIWSVLRLSSVGHWDVPIRLPDGTRLHVLAFHASTPAFDGAEGRNDLRNSEELLFWSRYIEALQSEKFVLVGDANLDPFDGDGIRETMQELLSDPRLQDPMPKSKGAAEASGMQGGVNSGQTGDPALDTVDWPDSGAGPGNLRVDYVLPAARLQVLNAGVFWPATGDPLSGTVGEGTARASRHAPVWVDIK